MITVRELMKSYDIREAAVVESKHNHWTLLNEPCIIANPGYCCLDQTFFNTMAPHCVLNATSCVAKAVFILF